MSATTYCNSFIPVPPDIKRALAAAEQANIPLMHASPPRLCPTALAEAQPCSSATCAMLAAIRLELLPSHFRGGGKKMLCLTKSYYLQYFQPHRNPCTAQSRMAVLGRESCGGSRSGYFSVDEFIKLFALPRFAKFFLPLKYSPHNCKIYPPSM